MHRVSRDFEEQSEVVSLLSDGMEASTNILCHSGPEHSGNVHQTVSRDVPVAVFRDFFVRSALMQAQGKKKLEACNKEAGSQSQTV